MRKMITEINLALDAAQESINAVLSFTEKPSDERASDSGEEEGALTASELFAFFTADIIRQDVVFVR
ncbi:MAG: hypothetical protein ABW019_04800 [Chitinophagaceae bacterium]